MKPPTKAEFKTLLLKEINSWQQQSTTLTGELKEQAIGRQMQCDWLLKVFDGEIQILKDK